MPSLLRSRSLVLFFLGSLLAAGCDGGADTTSGPGGAGGSGAAGGGGSAGSGGSAGNPDGGSGGSGGGEVVIGGDRPVKLYVPGSYDGSKPAPLLLLLHGYGASGTLQELYFSLHPLAEERGFLYAVAEGTFDASQKKFWNATDACCDFGNTGVDDSTYLAGVIDEIKAAYSVDDKRVFVAGHSNGGFMSYRMACDHADRIAAIVSLAGATFADAAKCAPSQPVAVLQIHGTADDTVLYDGGGLAGVTTYPGAVQTAETWATYGGCDLTPTAGEMLDLEAKIDGAESSASVYSTGCQPGGHAELWTIPGGGHIPELAPDFRTKIFDFLEAHGRP